MRYTWAMNRGQFRRAGKTGGDGYRNGREARSYGRRVSGVFVCVAIALLLSGCGSLFYSVVECTDVAETVTTPPTGIAVPGASWVYQLQSATPPELAASGYDIVVMDYSSDGTEQGAYTKTELDSIRAGEGPDTILAYLSIGEAEDYRYYFDPEWIGLFGRPTDAAPCWLGRTNPEWRGNYKVQYWSAAWHQVVMGYLDRITAAGFDGVYLDIIDGYEYWTDSDNGEGFALTEHEAADRMMNLVLAIAGHARAADPDFLVVPQNGSPIIAFDDGGGDFPAGAYVDTISGIGVEDLFYDETRKKDDEDVTTRLGYLTQIGDAGKTVLVVDYVDDGSGSDSNAERVADFADRVTAEGFVPYVALENRELDVIN